MFSPFEGLPTSGRATPPLDLESPSAARIYDAYRDGRENWSIDRCFAAAVAEAMPSVSLIARANREFVHRAVTALARTGVAQFLDLGAGIPAEPHLHETVQAVDPDARVVYVDFEPVAAAKLAITADEDRERLAAVHRDVRDVQGVWEDAIASGVFDPTRPVALVFGAVLHFIPDHDQAWLGLGRVLAAYRTLLPPGSALVMTHATDDGVPVLIAPQIRAVAELYRTTTTPAVLRSRAEVAALFGDFELAGAGLIWVPQWRPDLIDSPATRELAADPAGSCLLGGVARKPSTDGGAER
ncbi:SAM-dependent methyltransferase [Amycolatopsis sp. NPDC006125]|uniref:SAM-dependent methyltransferase n=1 Tax=Amycolatopsis sp. NPDC006125 TaxID=3156730 RepID=UPI0033A5AD06